MQMLRQFVQRAGAGLLGVPRVDAQRNGADFRLPEQRECGCPFGVFGGGHDKLANLRGAGLGDDVRQPEKQGRVGEMGVGVGEHGGRVFIAINKVALLLTYLNSV